MRYVVFLVSIQFGLCSSHCVAADVEVILQTGFAGYAGAMDVSVSVDGQIAHRNLGAMPSLDIWHEGGVAFLRFDVSMLPREAVVKKATLEMYAISCGFSNEQMERRWPVSVYICKYNWAEGTGVPTEDKRDGATLDTRDGMAPWIGRKPVSCAGSLIGGAVVGNVANEWVQWRLKTTAVKRWISRPEENFGVLVWGKPPGKAVSFASRESDVVSQRPILRLVLSVPDAEVAAVKQNFPSNAGGGPTGKDAISVEVKLAVEHAGPAGAKDGRLIARFRVAIDGIRKSYSREKPDREEVARVLLSVKKMAKKEGIEIDLLEFAEGLDFMLRDLDGQIRVSDAAAYVLLSLINESK